MRVKHFHGGQLHSFILSSQDIDQPVQLHHAKVLASLQRPDQRQRRDATVNVCFDLNIRNNYCFMAQSHFYLPTVEDEPEPPRYCPLVAVTPNNNNNNNIIILIQVQQPPSPVEKQ